MWRKMKRLCRNWFLSVRALVGTSVVHNPDLCGQVVCVRHLLLHPGPGDHCGQGDVDQGGPRLQVSQGLQPWHTEGLLHVTVTLHIYKCVRSWQRKNCQSTFTQYSPGNKRWEMRNATALLPTDLCLCLGIWLVWGEEIWGHCGTLTRTGETGTLGPRYTIMMLQSELLLNCVKGSPNIDHPGHPVSPTSLASGSAH